MHARNTWKSVAIAALGSLALAQGSARAETPSQAFEASGPILSIDTGDVTAAGTSGRFVVKDRTVLGTFYGSIGGEAGASFSLVYGSNVPIATQSGQVHGVISAEGYEAATNFESSIGLTPLPCAVPDGQTCIGTPAGNFIPGLILQGTFTFTSGAQGRGTLNGWLIPILDAEGHILAIYASSLTLAGEWQQP